MFELVPLCTLLSIGLRVLGIDGGLKPPIQNKIHNMPFGVIASRIVVDVERESCVGLGVPGILFWKERIRNKVNHKPFGR